MKKWISLLAALILIGYSSMLVSCDASKYAPNGLEYKVNEDGKTCTIVGIGKCTDTVVTVPQKIGKYQVTGIGKEAFCAPKDQVSEFCASITKFILPDGLITIESSAFLGCTALTDLVIPNSVTTVGASAFYECTNLKALTLSEGLTVISSNMCCGCTALESIVIPNSVTKIDESAFLQSGLKQVTLGTSVLEIKGFAFHSFFAFPSFCYSGTLEQWKDISVDPPMVADYEESVLKCTDVEIILQEVYYGKQ